MKGEGEGERKKTSEMTNDSSHRLLTNVAGDYWHMHQDMHEMKVTVEERGQRMEMELNEIGHLLKQLQYAVMLQNFQSGNIHGKDLMDATVEQNKGGEETGNWHDDRDIRYEVIGDREDMDKDQERYDKEGKNKGRALQHKVEEEEEIRSETERLLLEELEKRRRFVWAVIQAVRW